MRKQIYIFILLFGLVPNLYSQESDYDDLRAFTRKFSSSDLQKSNNSQQTIDSIVNVTDGINIEIKLTKEFSKWDNGNLRFVRYYHSTQPYGVWKYYEQNGLLKYTLTNFSNYFTVQIHFPNNNIRSIRKFALGTDEDLVGCDEEDYFPDGSMQAFGKKEPVTVINHWELLETGKWRYFYPNGILESIGKFKTGKKEGKWIFYNNSGKKVRAVVFKNGVLVSQKEY